MGVRSISLREGSTSKTRNVSSEFRKNFDRSKTYLGVTQSDTTLDQPPESVPVHLIHRFRGVSGILELDKYDWTVTLRSELEAFEARTPRESVAKTYEREKR